MDKPTIARIWRGRTARSRADEYEKYLYGIVTISYWESVQAMSRFAGKDPTRIHHLEKDREYLLELPKAVQILRIISAAGNFRRACRSGALPFDYWV
jgi:hypothetical protein